MGQQQSYLLKNKQWYNLDQKYNDKLSSNAISGLGIYTKCTLLG